MILPGDRTSQRDPPEDIAMKFPHLPVFDPKDVESSPTESACSPRSEDIIFYPPTIPKLDINGSLDFRQGSNILDADGSSGKCRAIAQSQWFVRWMQIGPLAGVLALCGTIGSVFFSLAILLASNDQPLEDWTVQPTVYLAISAAIANASLGVAYARGVPVAW